MHTLRLVGVTALLLALAACGSNGIPASINYATLNFTVTDAATGAPIAGARVTVDSTSQLGGFTSSNGTLSVSPVPPGSYNYAVSASGYQPINDAPPPGPSTISPGAMLTIAVPLQK